jgi:hypothetical protein
VLAIELLPALTRGTRVSRRGASGAVPLRSTSVSAVVTAVLAARVGRRSKRTDRRCDAYDPAWPRDNIDRRDERWLGLPHFIHRRPLT